MQQKICFSVDELAELTNIGRTRLYEEMNAGHLRFVKVGTRRIVPREAVDAWLRAKAEAVAA